MPHVASNLRYPLLWVTIGWVMIGLIIYLTLTPEPFKFLEFSFSDKLKHLLSYTVLMGWFCQLYNLRKHQLILAILFCLMGISLEILQDLGGKRYFEYADMAANTAGVLTGWWLSVGWCAGWLYRVEQALPSQ